jgi:hypothetical protein
MPMNAVREMNERLREIKGKYPEVERRDPVLYEALGNLINGVPLEECMTRLQAESSNNQRLLIIFLYCAIVYLEVNL